MSEQITLPLKRKQQRSKRHTSPLDMARMSHQRYIVKRQAEDLENAIEYYVEAIKSSPKIIIVWLVLCMKKEKSLCRSQSNSVKRRLRWSLTT